MQTYAILPLLGLVGAEVVGSSIWLSRLRPLQPELVSFIESHSAMRHVNDVETGGGGRLQISKADFQDFILHSSAVAKRQIGELVGLHQASLQALRQLGKGKSLKPVEPAVPSRGRAPTRRGTVKLMEKVCARPPPSIVTP